MPKISFTITDAQKTVLDDYIHHKRGFRTLADLARFSVYAYIKRNPTGNHGAVLHRTNAGDLKEV